MHLGDVVVEGEDLLGDGVNVAARLEQLCPPGGVLISGAAHEQLPGKLDLAFEDAGEQRLKNIARPVRAYRLTPEGAPSRLAPAPRAGEKPAIAVLPFQNMSGDPEQVYFSDGITDDVITELSRFRELMVIARNSSFAFRGKSMDVREIGRALGAAYVIEGNVRRAGNRVRITAQLVDAASGTHLWAERYDRAIEDVFAVRRRSPRASSRPWHSGSSMRERDRGPAASAGGHPGLRSVPQGRCGSTTPSPPRRRHRSRRSTSRRAPSTRPLRAPIRASPISISTAPSTSSRRGLSPDEHRFSALRLAEQALALDPNDPRVHCTLGMMCACVRDFGRGNGTSGLGDEPERCCEPDLLGVLRGRPVSPRRV